MSKSNRIPANLIPRHLIIGATGLLPGVYAVKIGELQGDGPWGSHIPVVVQPDLDPAEAEHTITIGPCPDDDSN